jgi:hypothetical protein
LLFDPNFVSLCKTLDLFWEKELLDLRLERGLQVPPTRQVVDQ